MYKAAVVGDRESISDFAALGLSVFPVSSADETAKLVNRLAANNFAVIYITEAAAAEIDDTIAKYRNRRLPAIILIPAISGNTGNGMKNLHEAVEKAVGSDILN